MCKIKRSFFVHIVKDHGNISCKKLENTALYDTKHLKTVAQILPCYAFNAVAYTVS